MKTIRFILASLLLLAGLCQAEPAAADSLILLSEELPPYNYLENGVPKGISVDLMALMLERMNSTKTRKDIEMLPWSRAYKRVQAQENTVLFAMARTPEREALFKWVGPIATSNTALIARKKPQIKINSIEDAKKYSIGVVRDGVDEQLMVAAGIPWQNLDVVAKPQQNILKLSRGRIDLMVHDEVVAQWMLRQKGLNPDDFEAVFVVVKCDYYFALNKKTPDALIQALQKSLDELKKAGRHQEILNRYLK
jgi:polar amino acid transport system substrate-binding protein